jgi:ribonuclease HI
MSLQPSYIAFCDGGCTGNGKSNARASFATIVVTPTEITEIYGSVIDREYTLVDDHLQTTDTHVNPSNNRGEMLAIIHTLLELLKYADAAADAAANTAKFEVISDSQICLNTLLSWLPTRLAKGTEKELKNFDLVMIAWKIYNKFAGTCKLTHTKGHLKKPISNSIRDRMIFEGNNRVDKLASYAIENSGSELNINRYVRPSCESIW